MARFIVDNRPGAIDWETAGDAQKRVLQNVKNLISLRRGELPYDRLRGIDTGLFDMNLADASSCIAPEVDRVLKWEQRAVAMSSAVSRNEYGELIITVEVEIL